MVIKVNSSFTANGAPEVILRCTVDKNIYSLSVFLNIFRFLNENYEKGTREYEYFKNIYNYVLIFLQESNSTDISNKAMDYLVRHGIETTAFWSNLSESNGTKLLSVDPSFYGMFGVGEYELKSMLGISHVKH